MLIGTRLDAPPDAATPKETEVFGLAFAWGPCLPQRVPGDTGPVRAAAGAVTTKTKEIGDDSSISAESPTEFRR